jgi:hypothetical protein
MFRRFVLERTDDVSGVSGTGIVAEGCEFSNKKCVLVWITKLQSVAVYDTAQELIDIHGHDGRTVLKWRDDV